MIVAAPRRGIRSRLPTGSGVSRNSMDSHPQDRIAEIAAAMVP
jgi:hypothetical protein